MGNPGNPFLLVALPLARCDIETLRGQGAVAAGPVELCGAQLCEKLWGASASLSWNPPEEESGPPETSSQMG